MKTRSAPPRRVVLAFVAVYLAVQIVVPVVGLYAAHVNDQAYPFSWHMFSRLPDDAGQP